MEKQENLFLLICPKYFPDHGQYFIQTWKTYLKELRNKAHNPELWGTEIIWEIIKFIIFYFCV